MDRLKALLESGILISGIENLREEVKKGMRQKAEQGIYQGKGSFSGLGVCPRIPFRSIEFA